MYSLLGFASNIATLTCLAATRDDPRPSTTAQLKDSLVEFLRRCHPRVPYADASGPAFIEDQDTENALAALYRVDSVVNDRSQGSMMGAPFPARDRDEKRRRCEAALALLTRLDPVWSVLFDTVVDSIFFRNSPSAAGGSVSSGIGVMWFVAREDLGIGDFAELLVHELSHQLLFLDELRYGHYHYQQVRMRDNFARSSILRIERPLDKVVHSIVVSTDLILSRGRFLRGLEGVRIHPSTQALRESTQEALASVHALPDLPALITPRLRQILDICAEAVAGEKRSRVSQAEEAVS